MSLQHNWANATVEIRRKCLFPTDLDRCINASLELNLPPNCNDQKLFATEEKPLKMDFLCKT